MHLMLMRSPTSSTAWDASVCHTLKQQCACMIFCFSLTTLDGQPCMYLMGAYQSMARELVGRMAKSVDTIMSGARMDA